jgi:hypothetical protein
MAKFLVANAATRLIYRMTIDPDHVLEEDELLVQVSDDFVLPRGGPWVLAADNITLRAPTRAERQISEVSPLREEARVVVDALQSLRVAVAGSPAVPWAPQLDATLAALLSLFGRRGSR